jgi:putative ABC transport system substrate-binding protein
MTKKLIHFAVAAVLFSFEWVAAQASKPHRIAVIGAPEEPRFTEVMAGLKNGLTELGYEAPALTVIALRIARSDEKITTSRLQELARQPVSALFLIGSRLVKPARAVMAETPMVFITPGDPVASGIVQSLARPGGNMTAMTFEYPELAGKRLEVLKELAPRVRRVLAIYDSRDPSPQQGIIAARQAAQALGIRLTEREARGAEELRRGLDALAEVDAYLSVPGGFPTGYNEEIIRSSNARKVPAIFNSQTRSTMDALASYGASDAQVAHDAARLIDKIIKGANAGELPVERPSKLELVINLKTAKQIGLAIPPNVLARADRVIR